ncbi:DUF998 domain-containing protein [Nocardiopsis gilva]|uniref:DUF998 domain-containing protein n=1 Tax=Nocardiopsis gilva TaxID=280236 RepID=UPI00034810E2|nr:DUF998 domain-containing protein [Nocardiopsis gilva]
MAAIAAAVCYSVWLAEFVLPTGIDPVVSFLSELSAADAPFGALFRGADRVSGVLAMVCALAGLSGGSRGRWSSVLWFGVLLFGAATFADSFLTLDCMVSADAVCAAKERAGDLSAAHTAHAYSSAIAGAAALVGAGALALHERGSRAAVLMWALFAVQLAAMVAVLALLALGSGQPVDGLGIAQRVQIGAVAAWLVAVGALPRPWRRDPEALHRA